jgi:hypothetical protein
MASPRKVTLQHIPRSLNKRADDLAEISGPHPEPPVRFSRCTNGIRDCQQPPTKKENDVAVGISRPLGPLDGEMKKMELEG